MTLDPNNNRTISQLQQAATLSGTEVMAVVQGGITVRTTAQAVANLGGGGGTSINGLTGDVLLAAGTDISLSTSGQTITINSTGGGGGVTGSGTANQVAWWDGASSLTSDATFTHDPVALKTAIAHTLSGSPDSYTAQMLVDGSGDLFGPNTLGGLFILGDDNSGSTAIAGTIHGDGTDTPLLAAALSVQGPEGGNDQVLCQVGSLLINHDKSDGSQPALGSITLDDSEMLFVQLGVAGAQSIIQLYGSSTEVGYNNGSTSANITFNSDSITINPQVGGTDYSTLTLTPDEAVLAAHSGSYSSVVQVLPTAITIVTPNAGGTLTMSSSGGGAVNLGQAGDTTSIFGNTSCVTVDSGNTPYTLPTSSYINAVACIPTVPITINLPASGYQDGQSILIADASGNALTNNITINAGVGQSIAGASSYSLVTNYQSGRLTYYQAGNLWLVG